MKRSRVVLPAWASSLSLGVAASLVLVMATGCSSSSSATSGNADAGSADATGPTTCQSAVFAMTQGGATCTSCLSTHCSTQLGAQATSCAGFLSCICPGGTYDTTIANSGQCQSEEQTTACESADNDMVNCQATYCSLPCASTNCAVDGGCAVTDAGAGG